MDAVILIPARFQASRFPGKPLAPLAGKPMIQWVVERCQQVEGAKVVVATDDQRIYDCVTAFGAQAVMTRSDHDNGTQRIAEVMATKNVELVINVQGDEPLIDPQSIRTVISLLAEDPSLEMATLAEPISNHEQLFNPHIVKVVCNHNGDAMYFSRSPIPFIKYPDMHEINWPDSMPNNHLRHVGIYGYRRSFLLKFATQPPCDLEQLEGLEQLRALYMGARIRVGLTHMELIGVDTPQDLVKAEAALLRRSLA